MSLGTSLITRKSTIDSKLADTILTHPYFASRNFQEQDHFITNGVAENEYDLAVLQFLSAEGISYDNYKVEYWFQCQHEGGSLSPHCDYNYAARRTPGFDQHQWIEEGKGHYFLSPYTIAVYLEISSDMEGGELMISRTRWIDVVEDTPGIAPDYITQDNYETFNPKLHDVVYFAGSYHYHWINQVTKGTRKSMLINFWPTDL